MPITRIAPKRPAEAQNREVMLSQVSPGKYPATITEASEVQNTYKTGSRSGQHYMATRLTLRLETPKGEISLPAMIFEGSKAEKSLFSLFDGKVEDLVGKKIAAYVDRNQKGFLNLVEAARAEEK